MMGVVVEIWIESGCVAPAAMSLSKEISRANDGLGVFNFPMVPSGFCFSNI